MDGGGRGSLWLPHGSLWRYPFPPFASFFCSNSLKCVLKNSCTVFQRPRTAVTLDGTLARVEQLAQVLIVEQPFPVEVFHLFEFLARERGEQPLVPVEAFHYLPHPSLEGFQIQCAHFFFPPPVRNR